MIVYSEKRRGDEAIITMAKDHKCLVNGCSYLAYVIDVKLDKKKLEEDVRVVN